MKLIPKAERIVALRPKYNFSQCIALGNREIQTWFLQCTVLIQRGKICTNLFSSIAIYLSPLTLWEAEDLYIKSRFDTIQSLLVRGINQYCKRTRILLFFNRDKKAEAFSVICSRAENKNGLLKLLSDEKNRIARDKKSQTNQQEDPYDDLIVKGLNRLNAF